jgi:hypothetical protein
MELLCWEPKVPAVRPLARYHGYQLVLHHESDDRYRVTIFDPKGNRISSTGIHLERQGALTGIAIRRSPSRATTGHIRPAGFFLVASVDCATSAVRECLPIACCEIFCRT